MSTSPSSSPPPVANLGIFRPPLIYLAAIVCGLVLHVAFPIGWIPPPLGTVLGTAGLLAAVILFTSAVRTFRAAGTPIPGNRPTTRIVGHGPYRFTRNPIYLAFSLLQLGTALWFDSFWLVVTLAGAVAVMSFVVIPREERYLRARFPDEYLPYRARVRRWL